VQLTGPRTNSLSNRIAEEDFMASQETGAPTTKVMGGTIGAAVSTLVIWGLSTAGHLTIDESVKVALTTVITFACGYMIPPNPGDKIRE
jgi:hypothetical protein